MKYSKSEIMLEFKKKQIQKEIKDCLFNLKK